MNRYLKYILIISTIHLALGTILFFVDKTLLATVELLWLQITIVIVILIFAMIRQREYSEHPLDYGDRFKFCLVVGYLSNLPRYFQKMLFYKIDPEYKALAYNYQMKVSGSVSGFLNNFFGNMDKYEIEEQVVNSMIILGDMESFNLYSISMIFSALLNTAFLFILLALVISLFVGSEKLTLRERWKRLDL